MGRNFWHVLAIHSNFRPLFVEPAREEADDDTRVMNYILAPHRYLVFCFADFSAQELTIEKALPFLRV